MRDKEEVNYERAKRDREEWKHGQLFGRQASKMADVRTCSVELIGRGGRGSRSGQRGAFLFVY
jgi:hypothetical protein